jgi:uncharacterized membrane protein
MTTVLFALLSAAGYGASDFIGGIAARRASAFAVSVVGQLTAALLTSILAVVVGIAANGPDLAWGALAGVGSGLGATFLYRGLAAGRMGVIAPVSAVGSALVPVIVGASTGERPSLLIWSGIALAFPAIWLVSTGTDTDHPSESTREGLLDGVLAGLGFGIFFAALGQVPDGSGVWPLAFSQWVAALAVIALATALHTPWLPRTRASLLGAWAGALGALATGSFLLAAQAGLLTVAGMLSALYPAATVFLAITILREHIHKAQAIGLGLCVVAIGLVAAG